MHGANKPPSTQAIATPVLNDFFGELAVSFDFLDDIRCHLELWMVLGWHASIESVTGATSSLFSVFSARVDTERQASNKSIQWPQYKLRWSFLES